METIKFTNTTGDVYATIAFNEEVKCFHDTWTGAFGTQDNFRKVLLKVKELFKENKSTRLLTDTSSMIGSFDGSRDWIWAEVTSKLIRDGLRFHAMVIPKNVFSRLSMNDYIQKIDVLEMRTFGDIKEAQSWLQTK
jgi:SpoIIAA-like